MNNFLVPTNYTEIIEKIETPYLKKDPLIANVGDSVKIGILIKEGNKERTQYYEGIIIGQKNSSINKTIIVRRVLQGIGMERIFLVHSPKIVSFKLTKFLNASVAPECFVLNKLNKIIYSGRIDDQYFSPGRKRQVITSRDLDAAISNLVLGKIQLTQTTKAIGCIINY